MATVRLIAKRPFLYASVSLQVGDTFDASESDAKTLKHIGHAEDAPTERIKRQYRRRDLVAEP